MTAPAGWFPDSERPGQLRYWDGQRWTDYRVTAPTSVPPGSSSWVRRHPLGVLLAAGLVGLLSIAALGHGTPSEDRATTETPRATPKDAADSVRPTPAPKPTPSATAPPAPVLVAAPRAVGQSVGEARGNMEQSHLRVQVRRQVSAQRPGTVLSQSTKAGRKLAWGSPIVLVVSAPWPKVPSVEGMSAQAAVSKLRAAGFRVISRVRQVTSGRDDVVQTQSYPAGRAIQPNSTIELTVTDVRKPPPPPPPVSNCTTGYSPCLEPMSDYDCAGGSGDGPGYTGLVKVTGSDPYDLDRDGDGIACED